MIYAWLSHKKVICLVDSSNIGVSIIKILLNESNKKPITQ